jgi:hypothetical protein
MAKVVIAKDTGYGEKNEIKYFNPVKGQGAYANAVPGGEDKPAGKTRAVNPFAD